MKAAARHEGWFDGVAAGMSLLCLVHCLFLPVLIALVPTLSDTVAVPESFHRLILLLAVPASATALAVGYRRHRASIPMVPGAFGLLAMAYAASANVTEVQETSLTVVASLLVVSAHLINWRHAVNSSRVVQI